VVRARPQLSRDPLAGAEWEVATSPEHRENQVMPRLTQEEIQQLSVAERVQLAEEIWDSIAATPEELPLTEAQRRELDRRLALREREPTRATPWEEVRTKLQRGS